MTLREMIRMIVVLTCVAVVCAGSLAAVRLATREQIDYQQIKFIKEPALKKLLADYENDPVADRIQVPTGKDARGRPVHTTLFPAKKGGKVITVVLEASGPGYKGPIGVMVAIDPKNDRLQGIAVTTHSETPGIGSKIIDEPSFGAQFADKSLNADFQLASAGGEIQAISGATISSGGVSQAVARAVGIYQAVKPELKF